MPPSSNTKDPRSYVKSVPLPIESQRGIKIQARSDTVFNPMSPTRDSVRKENYHRRLSQMRQQGFKSVSYKPYQGIGDPFYLDAKHLILHALGQWEEGQEMETSSSDESDSEDDTDDQNRPKKAAKTAKFVLRRTRKDLNTLSNEISHARNRIRNVRLGHGLFQLVRGEREAKNNAKMQEENKMREAMLNEWQAPRFDSDSSDETDDELKQDVDIRNFMVPVNSITRETEDSEPTSPTPPAARDAIADASRSRVAFLGVDSMSMAESEFFPKSTRSVGGISRTSRTSSRRKLPPQRPYTPQHSNIAADIFTWPDKLALFRQLCSLYWILEAMNLDSSLIMAPITTCWYMDDIGGAKLSASKQPDQKRSEQNWKQFISAKTGKGFRGRTSVFRLAALTATMFDGSSSADGRRRMSKRVSSGFGAPTRRDSSQKCKKGTSPSDTTNQEVATASNMKKDKEENKRTRKPSHWDPIIHAVKFVIQGRKLTLGPRAPKGTVRRSSLAHARSSISGSSPSGSSSNLNYMSSSTGGNPNIRLDDVPEDLEMSQQETMTDLEEDDANKDFNDRDENSQNDRLSSARSNAGSEIPLHRSPLMARREMLQKQADTEPQSARKSPCPPKVRPSMEDFMKHLDSINRSEEDPRLHALAHPREKLSSKDLRADINVRPKSTPAVLEYIANNFQSHKIGNMAIDMRQRFAEITEEKALMLHDALEAKERQRLHVLQNKFIHMPTGGSSFHRALIEMRHRSIQDEKNRERRRRSSVTHQSWFMELINNIPEDTKKDWYFQKILDQLSKYGRIDSGKQSAYKFLKVLSALRDWEVCSPDISAAVEFCREKIVEMAVEEYEEWFGQQFPSVVRPHTAPPAMRNGKDNGNGSADSKSKVPKSAPPGGRK